MTAGLGFPSVFKQENEMPASVESNFIELPKREWALMILEGYGRFLVCHPDTWTVHFEMTIGAEGAQREQYLKNPISVRVETPSPARYPHLFLLVTALMRYNSQIIWFTS